MKIIKTKLLQPKNQNFAKFNSNWGKTPDLWKLKILQNGCWYHDKTSFFLQNEFLDNHRLYFKNKTQKNVINNIKHEFWGPLICRQSHPESPIECRVTLSTPSGCPDGQEIVENDINVRSLDIWVLVKSETSWIWPFFDSLRPTLCGILFFIVSVNLAFGTENESFFTKNRFFFKFWKNR